MALLTSLAMASGRGLSRTQLAELLWDERPEPQARQNLRKELSRLRRGLDGAGVDGLAVDGDAIRLSPAALDSDVLDFRRLAASDEIQDIAIAASLYQDDLMSGFFVKAQSFEDWLFRERVHLREEATDILQRLSAMNSAVGRHSEAISAARRALTLAPLQDETICALLSAFGAAGRRRDGIDAYNRYTTELRAELDVGPSEQVRELRRQIAPSTIVSVTATPEPAPGDRPIIAVSSFSTAGSTGAAFADDVADRTVLELTRFRAFDIASPEVGVRSYRLAGSLEQTPKGVVMHVGLRPPGSTAMIWSDRIELPFAAHDDLAHAFARRLAARIAPFVDAREGEEHRHISEDHFDAANLAWRGHALADRAALINDPDMLCQGLALSQRALDIEPDCLTAWLAQARGNTQRVFMQLPGRPEAIAAAMVACHRMLALAPDDHRAHFRWGWLQFVCGDHDGAEASLRQALLLNPNDVHLRGIYGVVQAARGADELAMRSARDAIAIAPTHVDLACAYHTMHVVHFKRGELGQGLAWAERLGPRERKRPSLLVIGVASYAAAGKLRQAGAAFRQLRAAAPHYVDAYLAGRRQPFKFADDNERVVKALDLARRAT